MIITDNTISTKNVFNVLRENLNKDNISNIIDIVKMHCEEDLTATPKVFKKAFKEKIYFDTKTNHFTTLPQKNVTIGGVELKFLAYFPGQSALSKKMYELSEILKTDEETFTIEATKVILKELKAKFKKFEKEYYENIMKDIDFEKRVNAGEYLYN